VLLPPPDEVRQRAWECAFCLTVEDGIADAPPWVLAALNAGPDRLGWRQIGGLLRRYSAQRGSRT
jgi:hypothetical protein